MIGPRLAQDVLEQLVPANGRPLGVHSPAALILLAAAGHLDFPKATIGEQLLAPGRRGVLLHLHGRRRPLLQEDVVAEAPVAHSGARLRRSRVAVVVRAVGVLEAAAAAGAAEELVREADVAAHGAHGAGHRATTIRRALIDSLEGGEIQYVHQMNISLLFALLITYLPHPELTGVMCGVHGPLQLVEDASSLPTCPRGAILREPSKRSVQTLVLRDLPKL